VTWIGRLAALVLVVLSAACSSAYPGYQTRAYTVRGQRHHPLAVENAPGFRERGTASWYDERVFLWWGGQTSLGEPFRAGALAGAHKTLPLPCRVRVTNLRNHRSVVVRLNDRGPFIPGRIIDLTPAAAARLGFKDQGLAPVEIEVLSVGDGRWRRP
jgi:rare lipoprotein A